MTSQPARASLAAAMLPAGPAPTMATFTIVLGPWFLVRFSVLSFQFGPRTKGQGLRTLSEIVIDYRNDAASAVDGALPGRPFGGGRCPRFAARGSGARRS